MWCVMVVRSYQRGHPIEFNGREWVYSDTMTTIAEERVCVRCGRLPTDEGYDACLGKLKGVVAACCGHGVLL